MSFFDDASLVMIPSGYKASKVYSVKPTDGTGDLTFTRSLDTATRVGPDGLIEKVRTNLLTFSEQFDNAAYGKSAVGINTSVGSSGIEANVAVAPDGTTTADRVNFLNQADNDLGLNRTISIAASTPFTSSFFIKGEGTDIGKQVRIKMKRVTTGTSVVILNTLTLTADYVRVPTTLTMAANNVDLQFIISSNVGGAVTCLLWGAQLETGDIATPYIPTTTAAVSVGMLANVPRLDYYDTTCPHLLLEPQRTNLITFSEQINNAAWTKTNATISANVATSPAGFTDADKFIPTATNAAHRIEQDKAVTTQTGTQSVFAKADGYNFVALENGGELAFFNVATGVVGTTSGGTASMQDYGNGWYRCIFTAVALNTKSYIYVAQVDNVLSFAGDGTSGVLIYGCQFEAGSFATSYIPTLQAAVTRSADAASKTGISALIGQTEGTLFVEMNINKRVNINTGPNGLEIKDASGNNVIIIGTGYFANQTFILAFRNAGTFTALITSTNNALGTYKLAAAYSSAGFVFFLNGVQIGTSATLPPVATFADLGLVSVFGPTNAEGELVNQALLFKTRLTNAQLAELTA